MEKENRIEVSDSLSEIRTDGGAVLTAIVAIAHVIAGAILGTGSVAFSAQPLGLALLCASGKKQAAFVLLGLCLASLNTTEPAVYISAYAIGFLTRLLVCLAFYTPVKQGSDESDRSVGDALPFLFDESVAWRTAAAALSGFLIGLYRLITGGFLYYDVYGTLVLSAGGAIGCVIVSGLYRKRKGREGDFWSKIGFVGLSAALVYASGDMNFYGISLGCFVCFLATLIATYRGGVVFGVPVAIATGLLFSLSYAPLFVFAALGAGALRKTPVGLSTFAAFGIGVGIAFYVRGIAALAEALAAIFSAAVIFYMLVKISVITRPVTVVEKNNVEAKLTESVEKTETFAVEKAAVVAVPSVLERAKLEGINERVKGLCFAFSSLSSVISEKCKREAEERETRDLDTNGVELMDRSELFATDYDTVSDLLADAMVVAESDCEWDGESAARLTDSLCEEFIDEKNVRFRVCCWGQRRKTARIICSDGEYLRANADRVKKAFLNVYGDVPFDTAVGVLDGSGEAWVEYRPKCRLKVSCSRRTVCAKGESEYCGDSAGILYDSDDRFYSFISDGMGSGREAAVTSGLVSLFLCKLLAASCPESSVIKMINTFLCGRNSSGVIECSATVDLMELDTLNGIATFHKSGAAPSYVFRKGSLFKLKARSAPLGILRSTVSKKVSFDMSVGDLVVMVSDGVTQGKEDCPRLFDLIRNLSGSDSVEDIADLIVKYARSEQSDDDISVIVMRIERAE